MEKQKPLIFGRIQRTGEIVTRMRADVPQATIGPRIRATIAPGSVVNTDEYDISHRLTEGGYIHRTGCHAAGDYARVDDGDGFCEVHVSTIEGFGSLMRSWLRPDRGISQEKLPLDLGLSEFVHSVRRRGKALFEAPVGLLLTPSPATPDEPLQIRDRIA